jgi:catecholate siderophore receptor
MNRPTPIAAALLTLCSPLLQAQQTGGNPASASIATPAVLENVTVTGSRDDFNAPTVSITKLPADLHEVPQSVIVVDKALMQSQGATSLADALRNVSGITLGGAEGGQIGNNINLNGFPARTDIYLDGFRDRGQYFRDTFALDQVEVLMGPSSMLFGRGSTGGVVNQVTKKANLKESTEVTASATSNGLVRTTVDHNQPLTDTSALRVSAMAQDGAASTRDKTDLRDFGLAVSYALGIGSADEISLSALVQHNNDQVDYGLPPLNGHPVAVDRNTSYGLDNDRTQSDVIALNANIKHRIAPEVTLRSMTQFNYVHTDARETSPQSIGTVTAGVFTPLTGAIGAQPLSSLFVREQTHDRIITDYSISNQTELAAKIDAGGFAHDTLLGLEVSHDGYNNQTYFRDGTCNGVPMNASDATQSYVDCVPVVDPSFNAADTDLGSRRGNRAGGSANTIAVYGNDTMALNDRFKLVGGLRYDRFIANISNTISSPASASQTVNFVSVRAGGIWQPTTAQAYYLSYGTSFNPSLEQLTGTAGQQSLEPEKNKSYELGGKWDVSQNLASNAALFQIRKDNARSQVAPGVYQLDGTVRVRGASAGATGRITRKWQISANYTYLNAQVIAASATDGTLGKVPINTPRHSLTAWNTYRLAPHWELGGGATYMAQRFANAANTTQVGGFTRWDATVAYLLPKVDIRLNLINLSNKMYYDALIQSDGGRAVPGNGRTAMLSLVYRM